MTDVSSEEAVRLVVSFVLYHTEREEVSRAVEQVLASPLVTRVVLVDNSPTPLPLARPNHARVEQIHTGSNLGYGSGHNLALARTGAIAPYHAVLNTDVSYGPDVLPALVAWLDAHPEAGLVMPRICYPDGATQYLCRLLPHPLDIFGRGFLGASAWTRRRNERYENRDWSHDAPAQFPFLSGCFMVLRRSVLDKVGGFDERFFMYGEDVDLSRRINAIAQTMYAPVATAFHEYRSQSGRSWRRLAYKIVNLTRYFNKWGWLRDPARDAINRATRDALRR